MSNKIKNTGPGAALLERITSGPAVLAPGIYDGFSGILVEQAGFDAAYLSGASIAYSRLGSPDIGLVGLSEVAEVTARICERLGLPLIVDADSGFGNVLNVQRTMQVLERAGAAAIQLEDQTFPKRCGHLGGKSIVSRQEMVGKIRAALSVRQSTLLIARTDAIAVEGFEAAMDRAEAYVEAGADILFVEAPESVDQLQAICERFAHRLPLMANMVEGGRTPILSVDELSALGFGLIIFPGGAMRAVASTLVEYYASLKQHGTTLPFQDRMYDLGELNGLLGTDGILRNADAFEMPDDPLDAAGDATP